MDRLIFLGLIFLGLSYPDHDPNIPDKIYKLDGSIDYHPDIELTTKKGIVVVMEKPILAPEPTAAAIAEEYDISCDEVLDF